MNSQTPTPPSPSRLPQGFTLVELLVVVAIVGFLATLAVPAIEPVRARAEKVVCIGTIRSLHASISAYLHDHKRWPQLSEDATEDQHDQFWFETLEPYGASQKGWQCPSIARIQREKPRTDGKAQRLHYLPANFDDNPYRPHKYTGDPWLIEIGSIHGRGNILIRADGGVRELADLLDEAGASGILDLSN